MDTPPPRETAAGFAPPADLSAESADLMRLILDTSPTGVGIARNSDGRILYGNARLAEMLGVSLGDVIGHRTPTDWVDPSGREAFVDEFRRTGQVGPRDVFARRRDGSSFWCSLAWRAIRIEGQNAVLFWTYEIDALKRTQEDLRRTHDELEERVRQRTRELLREVEDRRRAEQALALEERQYRELAELNPNAVLVQVDGEIVYANRSACEIMGARGVDELLGRQLLDLVHPDYRDFARVRRERALAGDDPVERAELRLIGVDGRDIPVEAINAPIEWRGRKGTINLTHDISARKRLEEQLLQAQKMEAVGRLTGGMAHDFNNLIGVVRGNVDLVRNALPPGSAADARLKTALEAADSGAALIRQLLAFARQQPLEVGPTDLSAVIGKIEPMLRRMLGADVDVICRHDADLWLCEADPTQIEQAVLNLAINARHAMTGGGRLMLETRNAVLGDEHAELDEPVAPGDYVRLVVTDTGIGMDAGVRSRMFEPFFTTKASGSGLGLSMVYGFVKQLRGHIDVRSEPGCGTGVELYLPRASAAHRAVRLPAPRWTAAGARGEAVLVVEDSDAMRELIVAYLEQAGYRVRQVADGPAALRELQRGGSFDLLVSDVILPGGLTGIELAKTVGERFGLRRVLYVSGYSDDALIHDGVLDPDVLLLEKPFGAEAMRVMVRRALDG